ncbi:CHAT domain-containing protein [Ralstonia sp. Ralssp135]|uniref:CHAT domain-containing protein n=1 Tax=Ralstonia sp. Ralssp135 TaxID=3243016 RepID=UPI0039AFC41D
MIVVPESVSNFDVTPFQGWNSAVTEKEFLYLLEVVCCLPSMLDELSAKQEELLEIRRRGAAKNIAAVGVQTLDKFSLKERDCITIFMCLPRDVAQVKKTQSDGDGSFLIVSTVSDEDVIDATDFKKPYCHSLDEVLYSIAGLDAHSGVERREKYDVPLQISAMHGVTYPNQLFLESLGYSVTGPQGQVLADKHEAEKLIVDAAVATLGQLVTSENRNAEVIVYSPSVAVAFYDFKSNSWNQIVRKIKEKWKRKLLELTFRGRSYSGFQIEMDDVKKMNPYHDPILGPILQIRQSEIAATGLSVAIMSNIWSSPSLRIANSVNLNLPALKNIEILSKRGGKNNEKQVQRAFASYIKSLKSDVGDLTIDFLKKRSRFCRVCSDVPLEWVYIDKLPLMMSHEISRTPMTPGNFVLQYAASGDPIAIRESGLHKILVVRSFEENDPLKPVLQRTVEGFDISERIKVNFVDVASKEEAISALNEFDGYVVVFDCHGGHDGEDSIGWLQLGKERCNTWEFAHVARIPPIVLLSACSTAPIGGSHASVANGFLRSGAYSVVGTFLPVDGLSSAAFMARIIYRIDAFLPAIKGLGFDFVTWRTFISGFLRMSYVTDVLRYFIEIGLLDPLHFHEIHLEANLRINSLRDDWFDVVISKLSEKIGCGEDRVVEKIKNENPLLETMRYCQIGLPERIGISLE